MKSINLLNPKSPIYNGDTDKMFVTSIFPRQNTYAVIYVKNSYTKRSYYVTNKVKPVVRFEDN